MARTEKLQHSGERNRSNFDIWNAELGRQFAQEIDSNRDYTESEKKFILEVFINRHVRYKLRGCIGKDADYGFHMRKIKTHLRTCFRKNKNSTKVVDLERTVVVSILDWGNPTTQELVTEHVNQNSEYIEVGESFD